MEFNLDAALSGQPVQTRDGRDVNHIVYLETAVPKRLVCVTNGEMFFVNENGRALNNKEETNYDLVMKSTLPRKYEDLRTVSNYRFSLSGYIVHIEDMMASRKSAMLFKNRDQVKAVMALGMLSQLIPIWNEGWEPNWKDRGQEKHAIVFLNDKPTVLGIYNSRQFVCFKSNEIAKEFLSEFRDVIEMAKPLLQ